MTAPVPAPAHVLDDPVRTALLGPHAHLAESLGDVLRYRPDVTVFSALPAEPTEQDWRDAAQLLGPGGGLSVAWREVTPPPGWESVMSLPGVQMVAGDGVRGAPCPEAVRLGAADVPEMLDLVAHAQPGPFLPRTIDMGAYLGLRHEGRLIAMAGERLHPPGHTEISAVCTHADFRGQGLAKCLVLAVVDGIRSRGETPFLHAAASNTGAIRLYGELGFDLRRTLTFGVLQAPSAP